VRVLGLAQKVGRILAAPDDEILTATEPSLGGVAQQLRQPPE
jgi:hypothetical protein